MNTNCSKYLILCFYGSTSPWAPLRTRLWRESFSWMKVISLEGVFYSQKTPITSWVCFSYIWIFEILNCTLPHITKNLSEALPLLPWANNHCSYGMNLMHIDATGCEVTAGFIYFCSQWIKQVKQPIPRSVNVENKNIFHPQFFMQHLEMRKY